MIYLKFELNIRKRWHLFNRRYTKEVLFLSKKHIKGSRIGPRGGASLYKNVWSIPSS